MQISRVEQLVKLIGLEALNLYSEDAPMELLANSMEIVDMILYRSKPTETLLKKVKKCYMSQANAMNYIT